MAEFCKSCEKLYRIGNNNGTGSVCQFESALKAALESGCPENIGFVMGNRKFWKKCPRVEHFYLGLKELINNSEVLESLI